MSENIILKVDNLVKGYGEGDSFRNVLQGVSFEISRGEIGTILGPSGSGKSTLMNLIGLLDTPDQGTVNFNGKNISDLSKNQRTNFRREKIGFIFQFYNLVGNLTVRENILSGSYLAKNPLDAEEIMKQLGLLEHADKFPYQLSGGQQQRCAIGRAIVKNPELLLCDEPTGALDYNSARDVLALLEKINRTYRTTILIISHNAAIGGMSNKMLTLKDGCIEDLTVNEKLTLASDIRW